MGLGADDPALNPFLVAPMKTLRALFGGVPVLGNGNCVSAHAILVPTDALLGIPGIPQSGTGQTTIFTGVNAAAAIGMHYGPYPNAELREILSHNNLFQQLRALGLRVEFGNAYPPFFFERLGRNKARRTATMQAALAAGVRLRDIHDLREGKAVSGLSMTNQFWRERLRPSSAGGVPVPLITPREAGRNLMRLAQENDFTAFEYALPDMAGHKNDHQWILEVLAEFDEFLAGLLDELDPRETLLVVTSDHGNIEDWSRKGHTLNPVPTILVGARRQELAPRLHSLVDITPMVVDTLSN